MARLPVDLITDILLRLPAKTLLRYKSVCKLWHDLISGNYFANRHLERSIETQTNLHIVIKSPMLHLVDFDTFENPVELDYPFKNPDHGGVSVVGCCHGLLYLSVYSNEYRHPLLVYNPTTRTHRLLPYLPEPGSFDASKANCEFGFGYDSVSRDYKCVRILQCLDKETGSLQSEVMVYSLETGCWRKGPDVPYYFYCHNGNSVLFRDILHWAGESDTRSVPQPITAFDLRDEKFSAVPLPPYDTEEYGHIHAGVLDDCLCLSVSYLEHCEVWVMKEYGVTESWTRMFDVVKHHMWMQLQRPICYSRSGKELFVRICLLQVSRIDLETMLISDVKVAPFNRCMDAHVCVENLLMLDFDEDPCADVGDERQQRKGKKKSKKKTKRRGKRSWT